MRKNCDNGDGYLQIVSTIAIRWQNDSKDTLHRPNQTARHREKAGMGKVS